MDPTLLGRRIIVDGHIFSGAYTFGTLRCTSLFWTSFPFDVEHWPHYGLLGQFAGMTRRPLEENVRNGNC